MEKFFSPHLKIAKEYWKSHLSPDDLCIDATCGNGHDTLFLSKLCHCIGLDIQVKALQNTEELLQKEKSKATLHLLSHDLLDTLKLPCAPKLIVYNLGYLPGADKSITTKTKTTLLSIQKSLQLLAKGGALSITCYPGHLEGEKEEEAILDFVKTLPSTNWQACHHRWLNRPRSPSFLWILKQ
jgi:hypothetical protein